jgi:hypothetical protein
VIERMNPILLDDVHEANIKIFKGKNINFVELRQVIIPSIETLGLQSVIQLFAPQICGMSSEEYYQKNIAQNNHETTTRSKKSAIKQVKKWVSKLESNELSERLYDKRTMINEPPYGWKIDHELRTVLVKEYFDNKLVITNKIVRSCLFALLKANNMEHLYQCNGGNFTFTHDWVKRFMKRNKLKYDMVADETFQTMYDLTKEQNADRKIKNSVDTTKLRNNQTV